MRRIFVTLILAVVSIGVSCAENTFPPDGSVRIGTTDIPYAQLDVRSNAYPAAVIWAKSYTSSLTQIWQNNLVVRQRFDDTYGAGLGAGIGGEPFCGTSSTGTNYYGGGAIKFLKENSIALDQSTSITFMTRAGSSNATIDTEKMRITSGGNVGVGTTNPLFKLHVVGSFNVDGTMSTTQGLSAASIATPALFATTASIPTLAADGVTANNVNVVNTLSATSLQTSALNVNGGMQIKRTTFTANYTVLTTDYLVAFTGVLPGPTSSVTITLPSAASVPAGRVFVLKDESGTPDGINKKLQVRPSGTDTLESGATFANPGQIGAFGWAHLYSNGTNRWFILARN